MDLDAVILALLLCLSGAQATPAPTPADAPTPTPILAPWTQPLPTPEAQPQQAAQPTADPQAEAPQQAETQQQTQAEAQQSHEAGTAYTQRDVEELARIVYWEARGESEAGQLAVANVVLNRVRHEHWPDTIAGVIYQKHQFTPTENSRYKSVSVPEAYYEIARRALSGEKVVGDDYTFFARGKQTRYATDFVRIGNHWFGRCK